MAKKNNILKKIQLGVIVFIVAILILSELLYVMQQPGNKVQAPISVDNNIDQTMPAEIQLYQTNQ